MRQEGVLDVELTSKLPKFDADIGRAASLPGLAFHLGISSNNWRMRRGVSMTNPGKICRGGGEGRGIRGGGRGIGQRRCCTRGHREGSMGREAAAGRGRNSRFRREGIASTSCRLAVVWKCQVR